MSKALTIDAIEASAHEVFCRDGFDRASLREIASRAGVSLSAIHEYFDSKAALYIQVGKKLFARLEAQRRGILEDIKQSGETIDLSKIVFCMVAPVVSPRAASDDSGWTPAQLRTWYDTTAYLSNHPKFKDELRSATEGWVELIRECCPQLRFEDGLFAYALVSSTILTWEATSHYITDTLDMASRRPPREECDLLVRFISAGIEGIASTLKQERSQLPGTFQPSR
jgi:AcrR family transcriptional regulator